MEKLDKQFENAFCKYVHSDSFRLPMSVKELRLFTERICKDLYIELNPKESFSLADCSTNWSQSENLSKPEVSAVLNKHRGLMKNTPIGLNSLSKTFNIIKIVGQGHFGKVFKAENKFDHRLFALKQVKITPKEDLKKVLQEVENLAKAGKHKNIVKYLDCFLVQEEWGEDVENDESESASYDYTSYTQNDVCADESSSFINFGGDASYLQQVNDSVEGSIDLSTKSSNEISIPDLKSPERPNSAGYSTTITCICIKMEFCDFTLDQLLETLKTHKVAFDNLDDLFQNVSSFVDFKETKLNSKFGPFSPLFIICQLLEGLIFIHDLGIVHRDLKPANIFIMHNGKVKIGDFGLSKDLSKESGQSKMYAAGTRFYMAPEFLSTQSVSPAEILLPPADMYSMGMVTVKMLGFLEFDESELFRINDKLRRNAKREVSTFLKTTPSQEVAVGTTHGNLSPSTRSTYLPLLMDFLQDLLASLLDNDPTNRLTAVKAKQKADVLYNEIFSGDNFFRPKIGSK